MRPDVRGIRQVISALRMKPGHYTALLKFFRSASFNIDNLYRKLITVCMNILPPKFLDEFVRETEEGNLIGFTRRQKDAG
jgi:hypothetical protein